MNYCPNCGADLTEQYGFDPDEHEWTCTECGYEIQMSDESTSGIDMFAEMAFNLGEAAYNKGKLNDATKEANQLERERIHLEKQSAKANRKIEEKQIKHRKKMEAMESRTPEEVKAEIKQRRAIAKYIVIAVIVVVLLGAGVYGIYKYKELKEVGIDSDNCIGKNYKEVVEILEASGFEQINARGIADLSYKEIGEKEYTVKEVVINGERSFKADSKFFYDSEVQLLYHLAKKMNPPLTSKEAKGKDYRKVEKEFKNKKEAKKLKI